MRAADGWGPHHSAHPSRAEHIHHISKSIEGSGQRGRDFGLASVWLTAQAAVWPCRLRGEMARRLMITSFGFNDSGGGTTIPRIASKELARRGWDVTVFHAAVKPTASRIPYEVV